MLVEFSDYGVLPTNSAQQNDVALGNMREALIGLQDADSALKFAINAENGIYQYTNNRWLLGLRYVTVYGAEATFQNVNPAGGGFSHALTLPTMFRDVSYNDGSFELAQVSKIDTANAGDESIQLVNASDASLYAAGMRLFIYGFNQQDGGFPPNARYFEWTEITAVNSQTGQIDVAQPLRNFYDERWPDQGASLQVGAGRILSLDRPPVSSSGYTYPEMVELVGMTFIEGPDPSSGVIQMAARNLILDGINIRDITPSESENIEAKNCEFDAMEIDKLIDKLSVKGSYISGYVTQGTGANDVTLEDCVFNTNVARANDVQGRSLTLNRNKFYGSKNVNFGLFSIGSRFPNNRLVITDNDIKDRNKNNPSFMSIPGIQTIVVDQAGPFNNIHIDALDPEKVLVWRSLDYGMRLTATGPNASDARNSGTIFGLYQQGDFLVIEGDWPEPPREGQAWLFSILKSDPIYSGNVLSGNASFQLLSPYSKVLEV